MNSFLQQFIGMDGKTFVLTMLSLAAICAALIATIKWFLRKPKRRTPLTSEELYLRALMKHQQKTREGEHRRY